VTTPPRKRSISSPTPPMSNRQRIHERQACVPNHRFLSPRSSKSKNKHQVQVLYPIKGPVLHPMTPILGSDVVTTAPGVRCGNHYLESSNGGLSPTARPSLPARPQVRPVPVTANAAHEPTASSPDDTDALTAGDWTET
jgi:hypothetical protein